MSLLKQVSPLRAIYWANAGCFSIIVIVAHRQLDSRLLIAPLGVLFLAQVAILTRHTLPLADLVTWGSMIAASTICGVTAYLLYHVGFSDEVGLALSSFIRASITDPKTYSLFLLYAGTFLVATACFILVATKVGWRQPGASSFLAISYSLSAMNLAIEFIVRRPLFRVSGEPDATAFFFVAGLFGFEFSFPLHLLLLGSLLLWHPWNRRRKRRWRLEDCKP